MDKLTMANDWALKLLEINDGNLDIDYVTSAWSYADAMQAEADKRNNKETCDKNIGLDSSVLKPSNSMELEWQPDWSQAPDWANWWAVDGFSKKANWYIDKPYLDDDSDVESEWNIDLKVNTETYMEALSFSYQGNWKDSLRKRP